MSNKNYHNSTIKKKYGLCDCGCLREGYLIAGKLQNCYNYHRAQIRKKKELEKRSEDHKYKKKFGWNPKSNRNIGSSIFEEYYKPILEKQNILVCAESGEERNIGAFDRFSKVNISWIAHILPKSKFPTIASDHNNCLILSGMFSEYQQHARYDSSWSKVANMQVRFKAIRYIKSVMNRLSPDEQRRARKILLLIDE